MNTLYIIDVALIGCFSFAAIHYAIQWWFSRSERVLLTFALQCASYTAFTLTMVSRHQATTIAEAQATLDHNILFGPIVHIIVLQLYAYLGQRRDHAFRLTVSAVLVAVGVISQCVSIRGTVVALESVELPGGGTTLIPVRTEPGLVLAVLYVAVLSVHLYGLAVGRAIWKRGDRAGALLIALAAIAIESTAVLAVLIDYAHWRAPHAGALPHAVFVLCMALYLARGYSARAAELRAYRLGLEDLVATRTQELRDAKAESERAYAAKSTFLADVSHEIRTPLGVMMLYAQILQRDHTLDAGQREKVDTIFSSGEHLMTLLADVLVMSKIEAARVDVVERVFDPHALLGEVERMFAVQSASNGVKLEIERSADLPRMLVGDGGKVRQILINLVSNAVKFTARGSIRVCASATGDVVSISVTDTGSGIAQADLARLFQPFEQLTPNRSGTGLGLAISRAYARMMGGELTVESTLDVGSTFAFTFIGKRIEHCKVLIVDDLKPNRDALLDLLVAPTFVTRDAADGRTALELDAAWSPDLVILDLRMPDMNGIEVARRMRSAGSKAAIGIITASATEKDEQEALASGADFFMRKPYDVRELLNRISDTMSPRTRSGRA